MAFTNFQQVQEAVNLINASLARSVWTNTALDIDTDNPEFYPNAIALKIVGADTNFYLSTNKSGSWAWEQINTGSGGTTDIYYIVVADIEARNSIPTEIRKQGMLCYVISDKQEHRLVGGIGNEHWLSDYVAIEIEGEEFEYLTVGNITQHKVVILDFILVNDTADTIEQGEIIITHKNDANISVISKFDDSDVIFEKVIDSNDLRIKITNNALTAVNFETKTKWFYI